jgi:DNA topoisomerase-3
MKLYLCEKPSQAGDIAAVLGNRQKRDGYYDTADGVVTWCFGHLLEQLAPEDYRPEWKSWNLDSLPICPDTWKVRPRRDAGAQLKTIQTLLKQTTELVIATDADREGEMIAREVLDHYGYRGSVSRLWLSALDAESVKRALAKLKQGRETEALYRAALARSRADWLVGLNLTRAATTALGNGAGVLSVGRVQTPTLALVVRRDEAIENFKPRDYFELLADITTANGHRLALRHAPGEDDRIYDRAKAEALAAQAQGARRPLTVESERKRQAPPKLFSLLALQAAANKRWGWSADKTLNVAQALYETHKATTYPRSDCPYLPNEQEGDVPGILRHLAGVADLASAARIEAPQIRKSVFDSKKITAHHAIIPTTALAPWEAMNADEHALYLLVARHYLAALHPDHEYQHTAVALDANGVRFKATGRVPLVPGWRAVFGEEPPEDEAKKDEGEDEGRALPPVQNGEQATVEAARVDAKRTTPPARYTEGTLLKDMAAVAKYVDDPALKARLKETSGIGTEATRASIIELLKRRAFLETKGKSILSTATGRALVHRLPAGLADPGETAVWEDRLEAITQNQETVDGFLAGITAKVAAQVAELRNAAGSAPVGEVHACPACGKPLRRRKGPTGPFWGCTGYPECKTTAPDKKGKPDLQARAAPVDAGKACPKCSKPLVVRTGRNGRFLSCSGYPECRHSENLEGERSARMPAQKKPAGGRRAN